MKNFKLKYILLCIVIVQCSCRKFIEISAPKDSLLPRIIFSSDDVATSAIIGIYSKMASTGYASGGTTGFSVVGGLSSDEYKNYGSLLRDFYTNQLTPLSNNISTLYLNSYQNIYAANAILEGLSQPNAISPPTKKQIQGEAYFIRAFTYFYLINLFGPVPLQLTTDYRVTRVADRSSTDQVYTQIIIDLKSAEGLLTDKYVTIDRVRPNLSAVQALLARTYLYLKDWKNAEKYATLVIEKKSIYDLVSLNNVFLKNSQEAIWQLFPTVGSSTSNTAEGNLLILLSTPIYVSLNSDLALHAFETDDKRSSEWVKIYTNQTGTYYYPYKYKVRAATSVTEYSMVLRLAEQYLIRSEARTQQENISAAIDDLDKVRDRAGLKLIKNTNPNIEKVDMLNAILKERRVELFTEWGHRWLDLKRSDQATAVLSPIKVNWQSTDMLYPIPQAEINNNYRIVQNEGY